MGKRLWACGCAMLVMAGWAQAEPSARDQQRARIQAERARIEAQFNTDLAVCQQRFAVTACVDDARQRRREALAQPRTESHVLDDLDRRERAAARREAVQAKQQKAAERGAPVRPASAPASSARHSAPAPAAEPLRRADPALAASAAAATAERRAQATRDRQAEIDAAQARIRARQAERARKGKTAAPLPVPAASR